MTEELGEKPVKVLLSLNLPKYEVKSTKDVILKNQLNEGTTYELDKIRLKK